MAADDDAGIEADAEFQRYVIGVLRELDRREPRNPCAPGLVDSTNCAGSARGPSSTALVNPQPAR